MYKSLIAIWARSKTVLLLMGFMIILAISGFLFLNSRTVDLQQVQAYQQAITNLKTSEAAFRQDILASRYELFASYDPIVASLNAQAESLQQLQNIPDFMPRRDRKEMLTIINDKETLLQHDEERSEWFKSRNALLKNSLRYLPLLTNQVEVNLKNQDLKKRLQPEQILQLKNTLNALIRNLLLYSIASEDDLRTKVETLVQQLSKVNEKFELTNDEFPSQLVISHANVILNAKPQVEQLSTQLIASLSQDSTNTLQYTFETGQEQVLRVSKIYQMLAIGWLFFCLLLANVIVWRRFRRPKSLGPRGQRELTIIQQVLQTLLPENANAVSAHDRGEVKPKHPADLAVLTRLEQRQDALGQLAKTTRQLVQQIQADSAAQQHESFAFLSANVRLLTAQQRSLLNAIEPQALINVLQRTLMDQDSQLLGADISPEQLNLRFTYPPTICLAVLIHQLKQDSALFVVKMLEQTVSDLPVAEHLWSQSYVVASLDGHINQPSQQHEVDSSTLSSVHS